MATYTSRLGLYKPAADGSENVNVVSDLNDNLDRLDSLVSFVPVTTGTYPASGYRGEAFYETDTGKGYINTSASASTISTSQILVAGANFDSNIALSSSAGQVKVGTTSSFAKFAAGAGTASDLFLSSRTLTDSSNRYQVNMSGQLVWGPGTGTTDTNLYRASANTLATDDSFTVGNALTVTGASTLDDVTVGGLLYVGTAQLSPQLHVATTIASSSSEAALQTFTIPANDAEVGAVYRIRAYGTAVCTGTPTMTFRFRIGGTAGTLLIDFAAITCRSGMADGWWEIEAYATCSSTGASGTWSPFMKGTHGFVTSAATITNMVTEVIGSVTKDTTVSNDLVLTGQWSVSSASNSIVCRGSHIGRVA